MCKYCNYCMSAIEDSENICPVCGNEDSVDVAAHHLLPGTLLNGRFYVGKALGEGGFGITYIGRDTNLDMKVAIKEFYPNGYVNRSNTISAQVNDSVTAGRKDFFIKGRERFLQEARVLAKFSGESGIVNVRDFFEENNTAYIIMEYLDGIDLKSYLKQNGTLTGEETVSLLMPVMNSLKKVHEQNLIHRDISPDNIMLVGDKVKLLDFGAARSVSASENRSLSVMLKPGYAPEEQYRSKGNQGPWTDIYALCATMYKCITGITPDDATQRVFSDEVKTPSDLGINISLNIERAIMRGMSIHQNDRYQNIDDLIKELEGSEITCESVAAISVPKNQISEDDDTETMAIFSSFEPYVDDLKSIEETKEPKVVEIIEEKGKPINNEELSNRESETKSDEATVAVFSFNENDEGTTSTVKEIFIKDNVPGIPIHKKKPIAPTNFIEQNENTEEQEKNLKEKSKSKKKIAIIILAIFAFITLVVSLFFVSGFFNKKTPVYIEGGMPGYSDIGAISAGNSHTVRLKSDGTVVATKYIGENEFYYGQCDVEDWKDIVAISADWGQTVGLKSDGTVVAVGDNFYGECDVSDWKGIVAISTGWNHTVGLKSDGTVVATEYLGDKASYNGQCDVEDWKDIVAISADAFHTVGLKLDGTVVVTGDDGECNVGDWTDIVAISAGCDHIVGLKSDGTVIATGDNFGGQCDVKEWTDIVAISTGEHHTVGLKSDGTVVTTEYTGNKDYYLGQCDVSEWTDIVAISAGWQYTVGLKSDGTVVATEFLANKEESYCGQCDVSNLGDFKSETKNSEKKLAVEIEQPTTLSPIWFMQSGQGN